VLVEATMVLASLREQKNPLRSEDPQNTVILLHARALAPGARARLLANAGTSCSILSCRNGHEMRAI
jgi:hypothetical protein